MEGTYRIKQDILEPGTGFVEYKKGQERRRVDHAGLENKKDYGAITLVHEVHDRTVHLPDPQSNQPWRRELLSVGCKK